jgi:hypothetical protein
MKKIQAKKKRDRAAKELEEKSAENEAIAREKPPAAQARSMLENDDDLPVLFA